MKKNTNSRFRIVIALILATAMLLLPMDALALGNAQVATPDEAELSATGASLFSGDGSQESPYLIQSSDDWDALSNHINSGGTDYTGKYFLLIDDISVSTVLGNRPNSSTDSDDNYFSGTFDGDGHTLNVDINESGFGAAPFAIAHNATIKNLHVTGTVTSGANHATGLVAASKGRSIYDASYLTIQNVTVSTDISCPSHIAGIVGHAHSANITMENVVFDGSMSASSVQGGMIGWGGLGNGARYSASFKDCLFAGTYITNAAFYPVAFANGQGTATLINDFYTTTFGGGGSPIQTTGDGQVKLLAAQVEKDGSVQYFDNINTAADGSNWVAGSTLKLMTDVTTSSTITVPSGEHTLDLNGHGIKMTGSGSVISVGSGAVLDLTDSDQTRTHKFDVPDGAGLATLNETSGNYTVSGGYITGGNANPYGGGMRVAIDGKFNMYGGTIIGNTATSHGGGVSVSGTGQSASSVDNFKMYGGAISYNTANWGGGIGIYGNVYIYDTSIISNNTANSGGGGIELEKNGRLYMCGGNVTENKLTAMNGNMWKGGGIHVPSGAQFHFSGSPHIKDNYQSDGTTRNNVFVRSGGPIITVDDTVEKDASVGVTLQVNTGVFTSGWNDKMGEADPSKYFTSDDDRYEVFLNGNGEAEIGTVPHEHNDLSFSKWTYTTSLPSTAGDYCLSADVTISSRWDVPAGTTNLCLNGHSITRTNASGATGMVINVGSGAVLNLYDCDDETTHYYTVDDPSPNGAGLGRVVDESTYQAAGENARGTFKGGYITGGSITGENNGTSHLVGGGVNVDSGSFTLNGGTIIGNSVTWNGGGVKVRGKNASFTMNGGAILANWNRYYGGGISVGDNNAGNVCKLKINGGTIRHNWSGRNGGAIHLDGKAHTVLINGGNIIDNYTDGNLESTGRSGGGILTDVTSVQLSGTPVIKGNAIKSGVSNDVSVRANGSDRLDLSGHLEQGADVGIYVPGWTSNANADYMVATGAEQSDIRYVHYDVPSEGLLLFCDGSKDWICLDGALVELSGGHHTHQAGTVWVSGLPVAAVTAGETTTLYASLDAAVSAWTTGSTLKLMTDVTTGSTITVPSGEHTLDLNGCGILMTGNDRVITINQGASLELNDSDPDRIHYITLTNYRGTAVSDSGEESVSNGNGVIKVTGGYLTGGYRNNSGSHDRCGAGVYNWGTFVMNGGSIVGNTLFNNSGGGIRNSGYFTMNGGTIAFNYASGNGGGVTTYVPGGSQGKMTMNGGEISDNYCGSYGGGIQIAGPIEMTGGSVVRNTAGAGGSGVFYDGKNDRFKLSGNPVIKNNSNNDDLYLGANATFMINGSLTEEADIHVLMNTPAEFTVGWKNIMGNADPSKYFTSANSGYAVILNNNGEAEIGIPPVASVINGDTTMNYGSLSEAVNAWAEGSTLKLLDDITTSSTITVPAGEHTLDLNGHGIKMTGSGSVINVGSGVTLDLTDSYQTKTHQFDVPDGAGLATLNETSGTYTVNGGYITGGNSNQGGGVYVKGGTLILTGGTIIGNQAQREGGGVIIGSGSCTMNGGAIIYNKSQTHWGGGINVGGPFNMSGGVVSHNYAGEGAGGVHCHSLVMTGGSITDNHAAGSYAGGVNVNNNATLSGNITITDNTNNTGKSNLYCKSVIIADTLSDTSSIGIKTQSGTGTFTTGWKDKMGDADPSKYFTSDNNSYSVFLNSSGEAEINLPPVASIISGETTTNYSSISDAVNAWTAGSTLKLLTDVTTSDTITVPSGAHTLDLNGYNLEAGSTGYSVVTVGSGAELTIDDTSENVGKITGGSVGQNYGGGVTVDGGTLTLKGGAISGNANTYGGIGNCGGGVHVRNGGKFYMEGGEISGNTSYVGGGVCSDASATTVSITGGVIKNNKTDRFGSAIWAGRSSSSIFRIGDVQIIDNISTWTADKDGEASVNFVDELLISGNPTVHGDWKTSGTSSPNTHINLDNDGSGVQRLTLEGALTNDTGVPSITMSPIYRWNDLRNGQTFVFTKNWSQYMGTAHPADYFKIDSGVSGVTVIRKDGEAAFTGSGDLGDLYITFDANGGEGEMDPQLATVTNVTLNENTFTRKDYSFAGWNTKKDGSGTGYANKASVTLTGDLTLYAQWEEPAASIISGETTTYYDSFSDAVNAWTAGSTLKLLSDVATSSTITVPSGEHTLDLNGYGIKMTGSGSVIKVSDSATLNLYDSGTAEHHYDIDSYGLATVNKSGAKSFTGGYITGGTGTNVGAVSGGGVIVYGGGSFNQYGGTIIGNACRRGGAVHTESGGVFTMFDGVLAGNNGLEWNSGHTAITNGDGGAVFNLGTTVIKGGKIYGNTAVWGGGIENRGTLEITEGSITNNLAIGMGIYEGLGGGVYVHSGTFKISGTPVITDNKTDKGENHNVYISNNSYFITVTGALKEGTSIGVTTVSKTGVFTSGWKANMEDADPSKYFTSDNSDYSVAAADGEVWLCEELTGVTAEGYEGDYDGKAHGITVSAPDGVAIKYGTTEGSYTLMDNPTYTDAGTYTVYYEVSKTGYIPVYGSEQIKITPINVTVTITGHTLTVDYDGKAHSADGYDASASCDLYDVTEDFTFSGRAEAIRINAGKTNMGLKAEQFENTNSNFASVTFNVTDGYIKVDPIDVTVTVTGNTGTFDYDGASHRVTGYVAVADTELYDVTKDFTFIGLAKAERTDAGTMVMGLEAARFENQNTNFATVTFDVTDGYIEIKPIDVTVTITGHNSTVDYDGSAHSVEGYDAVANSDLYDVTKDFTFSGKAEAVRTNSGKTEMGLDADQFKNTNSNFATVTFSISDGYIKIDPIDVTVTITGHTDTFEYDGEPHRVTGYDAVSSSALYNVAADFMFHGLSKAERTDAGTTVMGLEAARFENQNENFKTVTFNVTDGYLTIIPTDAVVTATPSAKDKLIYTGEDQELILAGSVDGGTLMYAIGEDAETAPAAGSYSPAVPTASAIGNYYIWYKVEGDSNHNSISPACFKITLADDGWVTISGNISQSNGSPIKSGATVILMKGDTVVDKIKANEDGSYYFTVPADVYNIVVSSSDVTVTNIVDGREDTVHDLIAPDADNESVLDVSSSNKSIVVGGLDSEANAIREKEGIPADKKVTVKMTVNSVKATDTTGSQAISGIAGDMFVEYYDCKVEKTVNTVTTSMDKTQTVLELVIPCSYTNKREITVYNSDGSGAQTLTLSDSRRSGTFRVDQNAGLVYIYTDRIATYAVGYKPYYSIKSEVSLGSFSGNVSVKLTKDTTGEIFELNNVSLSNISFSGIPKGTYSMTITWTDGAENTLTTPFIIK